jgi:hypothetical protein
LNQYLIKYLIEHTDNALSKKYIDFFKIELDWHIYNNETHISQGYHRDKKISTRQHLVNLYQYLGAIIYSSDRKESGPVNILSTLYFPQQDIISGLGYRLFSPVWHPIGKKDVFGDAKTIIWHKKIQNLIRTGDFYQYLDPNLHIELENFQQELLLQYKNKDFRALFLYTDQYFYSKYSIDLFKKMGRPSFIFSHGLPGLYSKDVDSRSDYLLVWSEKIKLHYLNAGFANSKIKVVGHPKYRSLNKKQELRSDLSDILIIPVSSALYHQHEYDTTVLTDRSMVVLYLYQVQSVLKKLGLKKARYRVHPSINKQWVHAFLDHTFYVQDTGTLSDSLNRSSIVIGSTSTVLLEALIQGVNYIVYEPVDEQGNNMINFKTVPPFDGSENKLMIANDESELEQMLRKNAMTDYNLVHDYIQDFDLEVLKDLIN